MGSDSVVARATRGGDLHTVSATGVLGRGAGRGRLAALRNGGEFGTVAARTEQGRHAGEHPQSGRLTVLSKLG